AIRLRRHRPRCVTWGYQSATGDKHLPACPYRARPAADAADLGSTSGLPGVLEPGLEPAPDRRLRLPRPEAALLRRLAEGPLDLPTVDRTIGDELTERESRAIQRAVAAAGLGAKDRVRFPCERRGTVATPAHRGVARRPACAPGRRRPIWDAPLCLAQG